MINLTPSVIPKGLRVSTKSTLSIVSILLKQNRFASAHLCGTRKQVFDLFTLMHEWLFHRLFKKAYKLSTCLKASRLRRRRIFGVLLETRHSPRPLSLCLQSAHLWAAHADMCAVSITGSQIPFGNTYRCRSIFFRFAFLRIELGKPFVF